jgi:hypothetical protein
MLEIDQNVPQDPGSYDLNISASTLEEPVWVSEEPIEYNAKPS